MSVTYADQFCDWLKEEGYTHCFFVSGGNIMHLLNSARTRFKCIPVVHEVAAGIAAEYFNETSDGSRAFAMVTAGPGVTNIVTALSGAWLESRELLVLAGQVRSTDLASDNLRQRGIQEINGVALVSSITKSAIQVHAPLPQSRILSLTNLSKADRAGPVFIEFCLDAQGAPANDDLADGAPRLPASLGVISESQLEELQKCLSDSERPVLLIGGGVDRGTSRGLIERLEKLSIPVMTTWNGVDRISASHPLCWGRPNTWGQRAANVLIQQSDLVIALGTRLGIQQTGFNWQEFAPLAKIIQVDIDEAELTKGHPKIHMGIRADANDVLAQLASVKTSNTLHEKDWDEWKAFGREVRALLPTNEETNSHNPKFLNPYDFVEELASTLNENEIIIPCSSGGAYTTMMQTFEQKTGQKIVTNKGLASMGYGLSGAIGAAYAHPGKRIILVEGDGGFAQNMQEVGTVMAARLPVKIFIYDNGGYASMRMTQANYFQSGFVGYDRNTGLGLPLWPEFFASFGILALTLDPAQPFSTEVMHALNHDLPAAFIVPIDPEQTYFPKISSRVLPNGSMQSNPIHLMTPELPEDTATHVFKFLKV